jgi:hypothetical protein
LRIIGSKLKKSNLYGVDAILRCPTLKINEKISLIVDTGANNTIINDIDMILLGVNYDDLQPVKQEDRIIGIEASSDAIDSFYFHKSKLIFMDQDTGKNVSEDLEECYAIRHNEIHDKIKQSVDPKKSLELGDHNYPSILGIDILSNYTIRFTSLSVILEIKS